MRNLSIQLGVAFLLLGFSGVNAQAQDGQAGYAADWGPQIGASIPLLLARDQDGAPRNLENLAGERGVVLFLVRSADW